MRTEKDILSIEIHTKVTGVNGWVVAIEYTDGKSATYQNDISNDMLKRTFESIEKQLKHGGNAVCL